MEIVLNLNQKTKKKLNRLVSLMNHKNNQLFKILSSHLVLLEQLAQNQSSSNFHPDG